MVVELGPRDGYIVGSVGNVEQTWRMLVTATRRGNAVTRTIVVVLVTSDPLATDIAMVDPNASSLVKRNDVVSHSRVPEVEVADDDVADAAETETTIAET